MSTFFLDMSTPLGMLRLYSDASALTGAYFAGEKYFPVADLGCTYADDNPLLVQARAELDQYFNGTRQAFSVAIHAHGTAFQTAVWHHLTKIPFGTTLSYAELARGVRKPRAVRAVANANARNPLSIIVPCHRVIGSNGSLTGYAGGIARKQALLCLEGSWPRALELDF